MKRCSNCKEEKLLEEFNKNRTTRDGLQTECKKCSNEYQKKYYEENREKMLEKNKKYYEENSEKILEKNKKYYEENPEKRSEKNKRNKKYRRENREKLAEWYKEYSEENREKILEKNKKYRRENREKLAEYQKKYREENPHKRRQEEHRRRALKVITIIEPIDLTVVWENSQHICFLCNTPMDQQYPFPDPRFPSLEHIIPLSRGGTHTYDNLTYTHLLCNNRKLNKLVEEMTLPLDPPTERETT